METDWKVCPVQGRQLLDVREEDLSKIVIFCGGDIIPYYFFCYAKDVFARVFPDKENENYGNYIFYNVNMGVALNKLKETSEGLKYISKVRASGLQG